MTESKNNAVATSANSDAMVNFLTTSNALVYMHLITSSTKLGKSGQFPVNHFGVFDTNPPSDAGATVTALVLGWRSKAVDTKTIPATNVYNPALDENGSPVGPFLDIARKSEVKDSGCMFGPEFLLYLPSKDIFVTLFLASKSHRREAPTMINNQGKAVELSAHLIPTAAYEWYVPRATPTDVEIEVDAARAATALETFNNPVNIEVKKDERQKPDSDRDSDRDR